MDLGAGYGLLSSVFFSNISAVGVLNVVENSTFPFLGRGLGGTVWLGESGSSLGDTTPLVNRLKALTVLGAKQFYRIQNLKVYYHICNLYVYLIN